MNNINNLSKLLKNLSTKMTGQKINLNPTSTQKQEQSSLNNETLNFNNGKLDKNDPYGGLIKLSGNLQNPKNTKAGLNSNSLSKLLKNLTQNNSVKTVKPQNTNQTTNTTQNQNNSPAFGSLEYILNLLGQVTTSQDGVSVYFGNYETRTDSQGRVIYMTPKTGIHNLVGQTSYSISYGENNQVTITASNSSPTVRITTYDASGKVIKTETKNVGDWNPIEVPTKIPAGEKGSKEYVLKLLNIDERIYNMSNVSFKVEQTDELGRATKINSYHQFPNDGGQPLPATLTQSYDIKYNQHGSTVISYKTRTSGISNIENLTLTGDTQVTQIFDPKGNLTLTKKVYQNGNYSEVTNNQMTLFDTNGNSLVNVLVGLKTYEDVLIDGEKITLIYENGNYINFNAGDKVIIDYTGKVTVQTSANEIKTDDKDGNELNKIEDGKIGSLSYLLNLLNLNIYENIQGSNINFKISKTDEKGRVIEFEKWNTPVVQNPKSYLSQSYKVSYGDNNEISVTPYVSNMQGGTVVRSTYNAEGRLVKEETVQKGGVAQVSPFDTKYINSDGSYTIIEFDNNGNVKSVKNYDKDGNEI